ncbi:hypothetical protein NQZ68_024305 [Dissostichus eleginoides]|uniref:Crossover junction endonuclease mus81 n=1 Tax=Dissostichus eleginoides TaxID=100907 RepID=A0AAD9FL53_DISEL|nr:hypothetical protein NQZ68_024305 [Dissostichus eleginoides]KAK1906877.1 Crossover junction endonuclease mus81 [Dissostichus eleginoides]
MGQPLLSTPINKPWPPMTLYKSCSFGNALTHSYRHHNLALVKVLHILTLAHFSCFKHISFEDEVFTFCVTYPTL